MIFIYFCVFDGLRRVCWCYSIEKCTWTDIFFSRRLPAQQLKHVSACTHTQTRIIIIIVFDEFVFSFVYCIVNSISILVALKHVVVGRILWQTGAHRDDFKNNFHLFSNKRMCTCGKFELLFIFHSLRDRFESNGRKANFADLFIIFFLLDSDSFYTQMWRMLHVTFRFRVNNLFFSFCFSREYVNFCSNADRWLKIYCFSKTIQFPNIRISLQCDGIDSFLLSSRPCVSRLWIHRNGFKWFYSNVAVAVRRLVYFHSVFLAHTHIHAQISIYDGKIYSNHWDRMSFTVCKIAQNIVIFFFFRFVCDF